LRVEGEPPALEQGARGMAEEKGLGRGDIQLAEEGAEAGGEGGWGKSL